MSGFFESNGNGVRLSKAAVFQPAVCPCWAGSRWGAAALQRRHAESPCAAWGCSFPCRTASCGEPR